MAYPLNLQDTIAVTFEGFLAGQQMLSCLHYEVTAPTSTPDGRTALTALGNNLALAGGLSQAYLECCSAELNECSIYVQKIAPQRYLPINLAAFSPIGLNVNPALPTNVAVAITKQAEAAGRKNVGTLHMPAVPTAFIAESGVQPGALATYQAFATLMALQVTAGGVTYRPIIFNRAAPATSPFIFSAFPREFARTMHRRTVGLGT